MDDKLNVSIAANHIALMNDVTMGMQAMHLEKFNNYSVIFSFFLFSLNLVFLSAKNVIQLIPSRYFAYIK